MSRPTYLVVYHSPLFAAHWGLWIPFYDNENVSDIGKLIHVQGSASQGFSHEFKRNYNLSEESRSYSAILLCWIPEGKVTDVIGAGTFTTDTTPADIIEEAALEVEPPGPGLRSAHSSVSVAISTRSFCLLILFIRS